jgi:hypothetical protein
MEENDRFSFSGNFEIELAVGKFQLSATLKHWDLVVLVGKPLTRVGGQLQLLYTV